MPFVLPITRYPCVGADEADRFASVLSGREQLRGVVRDGRTLTVPGMDLAGAMEIAELGVTLQCMTDAQGAAVIRAIEADPDKRWVGGPPAASMQ